VSRSRFGVVRQRLLRAEDVAEPCRAEHEPEHGGAAHERTVARVERIDPRTRGGLDAVRELARPAGGGREEVEQELRVAAGALDRQRDRVRWEDVGHGGGLRESDRIFVGERAEFDGDAFADVGAAGGVATRREHDP
jgi:hypothetical protein